MKPLVSPRPVLDSIEAWDRGTQGTKSMNLNSCVAYGPCLQGLGATERPLMKPLVSPRPVLDSIEAWDRGTQGTKSMNFE